ncbi:MAG: ribosome biogenesis GTPase Der [Parachlamydiales bacterium]|jgi:GTP-binding protein
MKIALVGRPNVGKSALFNRLLGKRTAIVEDEEGVTRDRLYGVGNFNGREFTLIDTGGIEPKSKRPFNLEVLEQASLAIEEADLVFFVVDGKSGLLPLDLEIGRLLFKAKKTVILAVNKADQYFSEKDLYLAPFYALGLKKLLAVSAQNGNGIDELLEEALKTLDGLAEKNFLTGPIAEKPEREEDEKNNGLPAFAEIPAGVLNEAQAGPEKALLKVALVGRSNVGKSSLINFLIKARRLAVSAFPGTTRDSVEVFLRRGKLEYLFIDTAGLRRRHKEGSTVEKFARLRTEEAIEKADICLFMLDAEEGLSMQDKRIAALIEKAGKGCLILINKWDLVKKVTMAQALRSLHEAAPFLAGHPALFISALKGRNTEGIFPLLEQISSGLKKRIATGELNRFVEECLKKYHPPMIGGRRLRIYYLTQVKSSPPRFLLFVNHPALMLESYQKYLVNRLKEKFSFAGVPLIFEIKGKKVE